MSSYLLQRLSGACLVVLGVVSIVFLLLHLVPGDPVEIMLGESASAADRQALRSALGLDRPLHEQYLGYIGGLASLILVHPFITASQSQTSCLIACRRPGCWPASHCC